MVEILAGIQILNGLSKIHCNAKNYPQIYQKDHDLLSELSRSMQQENKDENVFEIIEKELDDEDRVTYRHNWIKLQTPGEDIIPEHDRRAKLLGFKIILSFGEGMEEDEENQWFNELESSFKKNYKNTIARFEKRGFTFTFEKPTF